ncbi:MAG: hypothetical protein J0M12_06795 [Deltaproteobacteria bacterium]|nr:hypothetical protein [Deltaproteobacteria bacterium]
MEISQSPERHETGRFGIGRKLLTLGAAAVAVAYVPGSQSSSPAGDDLSTGVADVSRMPFPQDPSNSPLQELSAPKPAPLESTQEKPNPAPGEPLGSSVDAPAPQPQPPSRAPSLVEALTPSTPVSKLTSLRADEPITWITIGTGSLALLGLANLLRGVINIPKDLGAPIRRWKNRVHFEAGRDLSSPSTNTHIFEKVSPAEGLPERWQLTHILTKKKPNLPVTINNPEALRVFLQAAGSCTEQQPFPSLNLGIAAQTMGGRIRQRLLGTHARGRSPEQLQAVYLRELNKIFRDGSSALFKDGLSKRQVEHSLRQRIRQAYEANGPLSADDQAAFRAFDKVPLFHEGEHRSIWICEVIPKISRDLIQVEIAEEHFQLFGNPKNVREMLETSPSHAQRIRQLEAAYHREQEYQNSRKAEDEKFLFPKVFTYTDISTEVTLGFLLSMSARNDRNVTQVLAALAASKAGKPSSPREGEENGGAK